MPMSARIGIDLGGSKIEGVVLTADQQVATRLRIITPGNYDAIVKAIVTLVQRLQTADTRMTVGIGTPGHIGNNGLIANSNTQCLNGRALQQDVEQALGYAVRVENDANCFALAEAVLGSGQDYDSVFGVILGTGVGGGIVINKRIWRGRHHSAGEWGHNVLLEQGPLCYCGKRGCVETLLSGPGAAAEFNAAHNTELDAKTLFQRAQQGDAAALTFRTTYVERLGQALSVVTNIIDPDCIVLGGGLSNVDYLYSGALVNTLRRWAFHPDWQGELLKHTHGDSAGVLGAALLWPARAESVPD